MMKESINFLLAGVGGQGTILASDVLVNVGLAAGFQAKQAEVHGMSQRGGSVTSHVRWGKVVYSPLIGAGEAEVLLAFEKLEALRSLKMMRRGALAVVNLQAIEPLTAISGDQTYPSDDVLHKVFAQITSQVEYVNGEEIAGSLGNLKVANVVLLGALSALLEHGGQAGAGLTPELWLNVITGRVPAKHVELNRKAFQAGREAVGKK
jgi:indolepyruvate ferredoxin oxidoreductase beta subunit